jgi:hypothetical protein
MDPLTFIAVASALGGGVLDAKAQSDQAAADASDLLTRAKIERLKAQDALAVGGVQEGRQRMETSQAISQERADATGSAIDTSSGTAASVFAAKGAVGELDALTLRANAAREAWGHNVQADMYEQAARAREKQGQLAVIGSFLGTAAKVGMAGKGGK